MNVAATLVALLPFTVLSLTARDLPVWIPDSSGKVTDKSQGNIVHTRLRVLAAAAKPSASSATGDGINTPATIRSAYQLPSSGGAGAIAIVDAYHFPTALGDFNTFAKTYGLAQETGRTATTSSNQTFQVIFANGRQPQSGGSYIASWNLEAALDIEWAHALAPSAKIYLVEAASASMNDLMRAILAASSLPGVREVSMSWGGGESSDEVLYDRFFNVRGVTFFAAGGDAADELEYPSASPNVVSVGGTSLNRNGSGTLTSETVWDETGCGISLYETRPSFQYPVASEIGNHRAANDVAFDADPNTGVVVYDSTPLYGEAGWWTVGGTSLGSPSWAGVVNAAATQNSVATNSQAENTRLYSNLGDEEVFRDITSGTDGSVDGTSGWDQSTGLGSPLGLGGK